MIKQDKIKAFIFTLLVVLLIGGIDHYVRSKAETFKGHNNLGKVNAIMNKEIDVELSIWGASTAWVHFNSPIIEEETRMTTYNMGLNGTFFDQYSCLLENYLDYSKKSKTLVITVNIDELSQRQQMYKPQNFYHHIDDERVFKMIQSYDAKRAFALKLPGYLLTTYNQDFYSLLKNGNPEDPALKGFSPQNRTWSGNINKAPDFAQISNTTLEKLKQVLLKANGRGLKTYLCLTPFYSEGLKKISNASAAESKLNDLCQETKSQFLNYLRHPVSLNQNYFYNNLHLNQNGANVITTQLIKDLNTK